MKRLRKRGLFVFMRYYTEKPDYWTSYYGLTYRCNHPVYRTATLYKEGERGLCIIQQRFNSNSKSTFWSAIDPWLCDILYREPGFNKFFNERASHPDQNGNYPTVTIRQIMWALRMKPLKKERWETVFDRKLV